MSNEKQELERIASMPDAELEATLRRVAAAAGIEDRKAEAALRNPNKLRRKMQRISEQDIEKAMKTLPPEQLDEIMRALKGGGENGR